MRVLSIDPGRMTGVVCVDLIGVSDARIVYSDQVPFEEAFTYLNNAIDDTIDVIVLERFMITQRTIKAIRVNDTLDVIGATKCLAHLREPFIHVHRQSASDAKTAYPDARLRDLGYKLRGKHERDALRHALLYTHKIF